MQRAILILIDGCRADALQQSHTPHIDRLAAEGASCYHARTVTPSITLPVHFSLFTSAKPSTHGVCDNAGRAGTSTAGTGLMEVLEYHCKRSATFYSWEHMRKLWPPGSVNHSVYSKTSLEPDNDLRMMEMAAGHLVRDQPDFCFIYLERTDLMGHLSGWMSADYLAAIEAADTAVGRLRERLQAAHLDDTYHIIILSDHGGVGTQHQGSDAAVMTVPWIAAGPSVRPGHVIQTPVSIMDTAPTLVFILGIRPHPRWAGKVLGEIFKAPKKSE